MKTNGSFVIVRAARRDRAWIACIGIAVIAFLAPARAADRPRVEVGFDRPERFSDIQDADPETDRGRRLILEALSEHLQAKAATALPDDTFLSVTLTDVDLAGEFRLSTRPNQVRIVDQNHPPSIDLTYTLSDNTGRVLVKESRRLRDAGFLRGAAAPQTNDTLRYEKALIDAWLRDDFSKRDRRDRPGSAP